MLSIQSSKHLLSINLELYLEDLDLLSAVVLGSALLHHHLAAGQGALLGQEPGAEHSAGEAQHYVIGSVLMFGVLGASLASPGCLAGGHLLGLGSGQLLNVERQLAPDCSTDIIILIHGCVH